MDKLSEYIPFLIIIVSVILSLYDKGRKKKSQTSGTSHPEKQPTAPRTIKTQTQQTVSPAKKTYIPVPEPVVFQKPKSGPNKPSTHHIETEEEPEAPLLDISDMDEVKKAVIYSEIFNKKTDNYC